MRCLLFPHDYDTLPGVGDHEGTMFRVCIHCGHTEPVGAVDLPTLPPAVGGYHPYPLRDPRLEVKTVLIGDDDAA